MARPLKPTALHKLHGTDRAYVKKRAAEEPKPVGDLSFQAAPKWFNASQRAGWAYVIRHAPAGMLKKLDRGVLAAWVVAEDTLRLATITQNRLDERRPELPMLIKSPLGMVASPYIDIRDKAMKAMFRAASELGFTPAARPRLKVDKGAQVDDSPWAEFKVVTGGRDD